MTGKRIDRAPTGVEPAAREIYVICHNLLVEVNLTFQRQEVLNEISNMIQAMKRLRGEK